jgi:hypothetical protein
VNKYDNKDIIGLDSLSVDQLVSFRHKSSSNSARMICTFATYSFSSIGVMFVSNKRMLVKNERFMVTSLILISSSLVSQRR